MEEEKQQQQQQSERTDDKKPAGKKPPAQHTRKAGNGKRGSARNNTGRGEEKGNGEKERARGTRGRGKRSSAFGRSKKGRGGERPKSEFEERVLSARRVSRVVAGGRRFNLSVALAVGNKKGKVGIGTGRGFDMAAAMEKAKNKAQKNVMEIRITEDKSIPSEAIGKHCASVVHIRPSKGFVAGGAVRIIAELAGIEHINAKIQSRSKCHLNNAHATIKAFKAMKG